MDDLFKGLQAVADSAFPKHCSYCDKHYPTLEFYLEETKNNDKGSTFEHGDSYVGKSLLKLYRSCTCGATLVDYFQDRRDMSERGALRRQAFEKVIQRLLDEGLERDVARTELLKVMRGESSEILKEYGFNQGES